MLGVYGGSFSTQNEYFHLYICSCFCVLEAQSELKLYICIVYILSPGFQLKFSFKSIFPLEIKIQ